MSALYLKVMFGVNEDENSIESHIQMMQSHLGKAATKEEMLNVVAEAIAQAGLPAPNFVSQDIPYMRVYF